MEPIRTLETDGCAKVNAAKEAQFADEIQKMHFLVQEKMLKGGEVSQQASQGLVRVQKPMSPSEQTPESRCDRMRLGKKEVHSRHISPQTMQPRSMTDIRV